MNRNKLKNQKGETLVETLLAVLICCLALAGLSTIMASAGNMMGGVREKLEAYYEGNSVLSCPGTESGTEGTATVYLEGTAIRLSPEEKETDRKITVYINEEAGQKHPVKAYYASADAGSGGT